MTLFKRLLPLTLLLWAARPTVAQYARHDNILVGPRGAAMPGQFVAVCSEPANVSTTPCSPLIQLYSSSSGGTISNPVQADSLGNYHFYAAPGVYTLQSYGPMIQAPLVQTDVAVGVAGPAGNVSGATIDISANTLKNATNTPGHYPRNNGTQYTDSAIPSTDLPATTSNCSGIQVADGLNAGGTPACGVPSAFGASGSSHSAGYVPDPGGSAGSTRFLREDATWATPAAGGVTESAFGWGVTNLTLP